jgi:hypothetical protein
MSISVDWGACGAVLRLDRRQAVARPWARLVQVAASPSGTGKCDAEIALTARPPAAARQSGARDRQNW